MKWQSDDKKEDLIIYSNGICYCSVCTNIRDANRVAEVVNELNPTGIHSIWKKDDKKFADGHENPCLCNTHPSTHQHFLLVC